MSRPAGIPLLSGPPPPHPGPDQKACRKCGRDFVILFHRQHKCMHCGYGYCSSCSDYRALMPRPHGYDPAPVCAFCIELLNITALGRAQLRSLPIARLKRYMTAYNIPIKNPIDKNDLVDAAVAARTPQGCLPPANEDYYRKHSVPLFSTPGPTPSSSGSRDPSARGSSSANTSAGPRSTRPFPRPDLDPNHRRRPEQTAYSTYAPRPRTTSAPTAQGTTRTTGRQPNVSRPTSSSGRPPTATAPSATHSSPRPQTVLPLPPPPMSTLVTLPRSSVSALSVGTLKQILFEARVRVPPGVVEKEEIVDRVWALVEEERRRDNEGIGDVFSEMHEEIESITDLDQVEEILNGSEAYVNVAHEHAQENDHHSAPTINIEHGRDSGTRNTGHPATGDDQPPSRTSALQQSASPSSSPPRSSAKPRPGPHPRSPSGERSGLCVVCQDAEANIAIIDCGHLAMCRDCSDLVLSSSRECPLCRTRIVTEARLLRIFKT